MAATLQRIESLFNRSLQKKDKKEACQRLASYEKELDRMIRRNDEASDGPIYNPKDIDKWSQSVIVMYVKMEELKDPEKGRVVEIPKFSGKAEHFEAFWRNCKSNYMEDKEMTDEKKLERLRMGLPEWLQVRLNDLDWEQAQEWICNEFRGRKRTWPRIEALFAKVPGKISKNCRQLDQLAVALETALQLAKSSTDGEEIYRERIFSLAYAKLGENSREQYRRRTDGLAQTNELLAFLQEEIDHWATERIELAGVHHGQERRRMTKNACFNCGEPGHKKAECKKDTKCYGCNKEGHIAAKCPNKSKSSYPFRTADMDISVLQVDDTECRPVGTVRVGEQQFPALMDSGSKRTLFPEKCTGKDAPRVMLTAVNGTKVQTRGPFRSHFRLNEREFRWDEVYSHDKDFVILGADFLRRTKATIQMETGSVIFPEVNLTEREKQAIQEVVKEQVETSGRLGRTQLMEHTIPTGDAEPRCQRNRRIPVAFLQKIDEHVKELFREDLIEEIATSEWCSPVNPIRKKDDSVRLTIDYRELNHCTKVDNWPMPRIDEILDKLANAKVFSRLDMRKGYYQIMLKEEDRHKTAFQWRGKLYQWKRMPMGLSGAPKTFQRLMEQILGDLEYVECYLDDVIIHSTSVEAHVKHIEEVLKRIKKAGLTLNQDKCLYGEEELDFLGFRIGYGRKRTSEEKSEIMRKYPTPQNKKAVRSFLGFANYLRSLIPNYAALAKPLVDAMNAKKFIWSEDCEASFNELKSIIVKRPSTYLPDLRKPFCVVTDASGMAMGAVLAQRGEDGEMRIIEYMSKAFNERERRLYSPIEAEAAAVVTALQKWRHYLEAKEFEILSDHKPLKWLWTKRKITNPRLRNWAQFLGQFPIKDFEYIKGDDNDMADTLSRLEVGAIDDGLRDERLKKLVQRCPHSYIRENGKIWLVERNERRLCVDDEEERRQIITEAHDKGGHLGRFKTEEVIRQRFYWPSWKEDIRRHLAQCYKCAVAKDDIEPYKEKLKPRGSVGIWQRIHVDLCGPLTQSDGKTHILVAQDSGSKWLEAKAVSSTTTKTITDWLSELWARFGLPLEIDTDNGSNLDSREFKKYCEDNGIEHHAGTPYHHQSNGLVERGIQTIEKMIRTTCNEQHEWSQVLNSCVLAYNSRRHHTTGVSPAALMLGRELRLMMDAQFDTSPKKINLEESQAKAVQTATIAEARSKRYYDREFRPSNLTVGDRVLWHLHEQGRGKSKKLNRRWQGPFVVEAINRPMAVLADRGGNTKRLHMNHLKKFTGDAELGEFRGRGRPRLRGRCNSG